MYTRIYLYIYIDVYIYIYIIDRSYLMQIEKLVPDHKIYILRIYIYTLEPP